MQIKPGAKTAGIKPELILGLIIADRVYESAGHILVITEVTGGTHLVQSLHYKGLAADLRIKNVSDKLDRELLIAQLKVSLGKDWDVILESVDTDNQHVHIEFDPKG